MAESRSRAGFCLLAPWAGLRGFGPMSRPTSPPSTGPSGLTRALAEEPSQDPASPSMRYCSRLCRDRKCSRKSIHRVMEKTGRSEAEAPARLCRDQIPNHRLVPARGSRGRGPLAGQRTRAIFGPPALGHKPISGGAIWKPRRAASHQLAPAANSRKRLRLWIRLLRAAAHHRGRSCAIRLKRRFRDHRAAALRT